MKKKQIEKIAPVKPKKNGWVIKVQELEEILILNVYHNRKLQGRQCINTKTQEYAQYRYGNWSRKKLYTLLDLGEYYYFSNGDARKRTRAETEEEEQIVLVLLDQYAEWEGIYDVVDRAERDYNSIMRENTERNHKARVNALMNRVPELPEGIKDWIYEAASGEDFAFWDKGKKRWSCTACGKSCGEKELKRADGEKKVRHNDMVICPHCGKIIQVKRRTGKQERNTHFALMQPMDQKQSVVRHFDVFIHWEGKEKEIKLYESIRILLFKKPYKYKKVCELYYWQWGGFDNKGNPGNQRTYAGYLYPEGVEETLKNTYYEGWTRLFRQMAAAKKKLQYNRMMAAGSDANFIRLMECLFKGRFERLLLETSENVSYWSGSYCGSLKLYGDTIEDVFEIGDRQKINRIRDVDGGEDVVQWMRWSDVFREKIPQDVLEWLVKNNITMDDIQFIADEMRLTQIRNYVTRQQEESYRGKSAKQILNQWADYISMCEKLNKDTTDEMVFRPRELKRRHDEAVEQINKKRMLEELERNQKKREEEDKRMRERFPGAEEILKEIRPKYEYRNEKYLILVPERLIDIIAEGQALHHCAGSSDRYFDRIMQQETYICFLRKAEAPEKPYYTIEVEPGGTIRQHRGYLDEEPGIEEIKPFLREWQKEIRKRMSREDHKRAAISAVKREENIRELQEKNNTRVLNGLMEDFMEAESIIEEAV